jgi:Raf kinase inhibitor-like YbhB/YbcL family protein
MNTRACLAGAFFTLSWLAAASADADTFRLTSSAFKDGGMMPRKSSNNIPGNARCVGDNISPPLAWQGAPTDTKSFAITIVNPEGRNGLGSVHWVAYGIDSSVNELKEGEASKEPGKYTGGKNTLKVGHYSGPCTPAGYPQHYVFVIIATDLAPNELPMGLDLPHLLEKLDGHVKGATGIVGLFEHPKQ